MMSESRKDRECWRVLSAESKKKRGGGGACLCLVGIAIHGNVLVWRVSGCDCPQVLEVELRVMTTGTYQIKVKTLSYRSKNVKLIQRFSHHL